jgi:hypothetical protein
MARKMAQNGILLFTFSLLLLAVKQVRETSIWESTPLLKLVPTPPVCFSIALRIIFIAISFILMYVVAKIWQKRRRYRVAFGIILVLLLLFVLWLIPPTIPVWFFTALGIIGLLTSLAFMVAVFWKRLASKLEKFLKGESQFAYWEIFCVVYIASWVKGLSSIPTGGFAFPIVFSVGSAWFFIIMIFMLKAAADRKT